VKTHHELHHSMEVQSAISPVDFFSLPVSSSLPKATKDLIAGG